MKALAKSKIRTSESKPSKPAEKRALPWSMCLGRTWRSETVDAALILLAFKYVISLCFDDPSSFTLRRSEQVTNSRRSHIEW